MRCNSCRVWRHQFFHSRSATVPRRFWLRLPGRLRELGTEAGGHINGRLKCQSNQLKQKIKAKMMCKVTTIRWNSSEISFWRRFLYVDAYIQFYLNSWVDFKMNIDNEFPVDAAKYLVYGKLRFFFSWSWITHLHTTVKSWKGINEKEPRILTTSKLIKCWETLKLVDSKLFVEDMNMFVASSHSPVAVGHSWSIIQRTVATTQWWGQMEAARYSGTQLFSDPTNPELRTRLCLVSCFFLSFQIFSNDVYWRGKTMVKQIKFKTFRSMNDAEITTFVACTLLVSSPKQAGGLRMSQEASRKTARRWAFRQFIRKS